MKSQCAFAGKYLPQAKAMGAYRTTRSDDSSVRPPLRIRVDAFRAATARPTIHEGLNEQQPGVVFAAHVVDVVTSIQNEIG